VLVVPVAQIIPLEVLVVAIQYFQLLHHLAAVVAVRVLRLMRVLMAALVVVRLEIQALN
jgi:hypothetical protein